MIKINSVRLGDLAAQPPCISYRIPLEDMEKARQGVPMDQLRKTTTPRMVEDNFEYRWRYNPKTE